MSLLALVIALCGFSLAVFIPSASAQKARAINCTYTEYSEYSECATTTTGSTTTGTATGAGTTTTITTGTTQTITSTTTTTVSTGTATTSGQTAPSDTASLAEIDAYLKTIPGVVVSSNGTVAVASVGANLKVGLALAPGCKVLANNGKSITISDNGVTFSVPYGAALVVSKDGVATITIIPTGKSGARVALLHRYTVPTSLTKYVILPSGKTSNKFGLTLPAGVTYGKKATAKTVAGYFKVYSLTSTKSLTAAKTATKTTAALNKAHTAATLKAAKALKAYKISFNMAGLTYTKAAQAKKSLTMKFSVTSTTKGKTTTDASTLTY